MIIYQILFPVDYRHLPNINLRVSSFSRTVCWSFSVSAYIGVAVFSVIIKLKFNNDSDVFLYVYRVSLKSRRLNILEYFCFIICKYLPEWLCIRMRTNCCILNHIISVVTEKTPVVMCAPQIQIWKHFWSILNSGVKCSGVLCTSVLCVGVFWFGILRAGVLCTGVLWINILCISVGLMCVGVWCIVYFVLVHYILAFCVFGDCVLAFCVFTDCA